MLVAMTKQQQLFQLSTKITQQELHLLKQHHQFFCPQCKEQLLLKAGQIKIPHFAHQKNSNCHSLFSEGESTAHLLGKQHLYQLFTKLQLTPVLEPYLPKLRQRPDLLISQNSEQFAIEFQCSPITKDLFLQRTTGYRKANIIPVWLLSTPEKYKTLGMVRISINHTHGQFVQQYKNQKFLITYDVDSETFYYASNLIHVHSRQYFAYIKRLSIHRQHFPFYLPEKITFEKFQRLLTNFKQYRDRYLHPRLLLSKKGINDRFLRALYELQLTLTNLPIFLGIPVRFTNAFDVFCLEWQVQLFYFMKCHQLTPTTMNMNAIPYFLDWIRIDKTNNRRQAVEHYLNVLRQLKIRDIRETIDQKQLFQILYDELVAIE